MLERLIAAGHKLTAPRRRIIDALYAAEGPLAAHEVAARAGTTTASTYRVLALLAELGLVSEIEEPADLAAAPGAGEGRVRRYALCTHAGHHHHFVCRSCRATLDVESEALERALAELARRDGLAIERHEVLLSGRCPRCRGEPEEGADV
ncbi:MAG TPA: Fur family transcriptional regulator [Ktedonobacterales bacterium]|nr:Fur family transcriptional regulator [Ktedonobacterales bacterium]